MILVQCIGNRLRGDDGVGPFVADRLREARLGEPIQIQEQWGEGTELMSHWHAAKRVILVDAASSEAAVGTLHHFDAKRDAIPKDFCYYTSHRFGVAEAIEMARVLGQLPAELHLYAIEGELFGLGEAMSPAVINSAMTLAESLIQQLASHTG